MKITLRWITIIVILLLAAPSRSSARAVDPGAKPALGAAGKTERVSVSSDGAQANHWSFFFRSFSPDGRYVVYESSATNLVDGDMNGSDDIFIRDRTTGITERVSIGVNGVQANHDSSEPSISSDGYFVAFSSFASNLVSGDTNGSQDIFIRDRIRGTIERVSINSEEIEGNGFSSLPSISADGRFVTFISTATNMVSGDNNDTVDVFVRDLLAGVTERVSVAGDGTEGDSFSSGAAISAGGRYIVFESHASNLVIGDNNDDYDIFLRDRVNQTTVLVSQASDGSHGNAMSRFSSISEDGRYITFWSEADNLVIGDTNRAIDIYVRDMVNSTTERVSVSTCGVAGNGKAIGSSISADGRFVAFDSEASNLVFGDTNNFSDVFLHDRLIGTTQRVSLNNNEIEGDRLSISPVVSDDGRYVAFQSDATNLVSGDTNDLWDVFVRDRGENISPVENSCTYFPMIVR